MIDWTKPFSREVAWRRADDFEHLSDGAQRFYLISLLIADEAGRFTKAEVFAADDATSNGTIALDVDGDRAVVRWRPS